MLFNLMFKFRQAMQVIPDFYTPKGKGVLPGIGVTLS